MTKFLERYIANFFLRYIPPPPTPREMEKAVDVVYKCQTREQLLSANKYVALWVKRHRDFVTGMALAQMMEDKLKLFYIHSIKEQSRLYAEKHAAKY